MDMFWDTAPQLAISPSSKVRLNIAFLKPGLLMGQLWRQIQLALSVDASESFLNVDTRQTLCVIM